MVGASGGGVAWSAAPGVLWAVSLFLAATAMGLVVLLVRIRKARGEGERCLRERAGDRRFVGEEKTAVFFGQRSLGKRQIRGNGALALTEEALLFVRWMPFKELSIPLSAVRGVDVVSGFLGKSVGRPLLRVRYEEQGRLDEAAWYVRDPERLESGRGGGPGTEDERTLRLRGG